MVCPLRVLQIVHNEGRSAVIQKWPIVEQRPFSRHEQYRPGYPILLLQSVLRIIRTLFNIMVGGVLLEPMELFGDVRVAIFVYPLCSHAPEIKAEHVHQGYFRNSSLKQIRSLSDCNANQQTPVAAALAGKF